MSTAAAVIALQERFPELRIQPVPLLVRKDGSPSDQLFVTLPARSLTEVMEFLRDDPRTRFEQLTDVTCIDYLDYPGAAERFGVTYSLLSLTLNHRLWVKVYVNDPEPVVPSVTRIWQGANWLEREVFDLFGIRFDGHPDLRRILTPDQFTHHPLRKDYPLRGRGEREALTQIARDSA